MTARKWLLPMLLVPGLAAWAGQPPKEKPRLEALERRMAELVNRDRAANKFPPLAYDPALADVARAHCEDMLLNHFMGHESKTTGHVQDRVARAGIPFRAVGENLASAPDIEMAEAMLMKSPGHRANILDTRFTHVGIGILSNSNGWPLITQVFRGAPPVHDPQQIRAEIIEGINKARLTKGLRRLVEDDFLSRQALAHSEHADKKGDVDALWLEQRLAIDSRRWRIHEAEYLLTDSVQEVIESETAQSPRYDHFGLGVVVSAPTSAARAALWVTLIAAQKK